jgi:hypothetical protein
VEHLDLVLKLLQQNSLFVKRSKCVFGQDRVEYLGHIITSDGVSTDPSKISVVQAWPIPKTITDMRGFFSLARYYR